MGGFQFVMLLEKAAQAQDDTVWYFAYGSNMSREKFTHGRGIVPICQVNASIPGWRLTFEVPGLPYTEPGMGAITPIKTSSSAQSSESPSHCTSIPVHGVAYLVTKAQLTSIIHSEGGGIAYDDLELDAQVISAEQSSLYRDGVVSTALTVPDRLRVRTFVAAPSMSRLPPSYPEPLPSIRYMSLLTTGALEAGLPGPYQAYLHSWPVYKPVREPGRPRISQHKTTTSTLYELAPHPPPPGRTTSRSSHSLSGHTGPDLYLQFPSPWLRWLGIQLFIVLATALLGVGEKLCYATVSQETGLCPLWVRWAVRLIVGGIWCWHDRLMVEAFGAGDGRDKRDPGALGWARGELWQDEKAPARDDLEAQKYLINQKVEMDIGMSASGQLALVQKHAERYKVKRSVQR